MVLNEYQPVFSAIVIEQEINQGLSRSIAKGVSDLCETHGRVVVLEDDLIVGPGFIGFMIDALETYKNEQAIMQVAGMSLAPPSNLEADAYLLPITSTWGWATWKRAWEHFAWEPLGWPESQSDKEWLDLFSVGDSANFVQMLEDRLSGRNDSWGILWWYAVSRARGLVVYPKQTLVWNSGFDGSGVHCGKETPSFQTSEAIIWTKEWSKDKPLLPTPESARRSDFELLQKLLSDSRVTGGSRSWWIRLGMIRLLQRLKNAVSKKIKQRNS